jgi:hypothetical protein
MKRILVGTLLIVFGITHSQVSFKPGIRAGLNFSSIQNIDLGTKVDYYLGAYGAIKFSKYYTLQPEFGYSRQGGKGKVFGFYYKQVSPTTTETIYEDRNADIGLQYLSFVTINKLNLGKHIYLLAGPYFDFLIGNDFKIDLSNDFRANVSKGEDIDFGIIAGIGFNLPKGISLEARIKKGTRDAMDDYSGSSKVNTNLVYQIGANYSFNLK